MTALRDAWPAARVAGRGRPGAPPATSRGQRTMKALSGGSWQGRSSSAFVGTHPGPDVVSAPNGLEGGARVAAPTRSGCARPSRAAAVDVALWPSANDSQGPLKQEGSLVPRIAPLGAAE